jgi:hypothetical protein
LASFFNFWIQIYTPPLFRLQHAPCSHDHRRHLLLLPEAQVTSVVGA